MTQVATPTFTPTGGKVGTAASFELATTTDDATIYYSFGAGAPNTEWTEYSAAVDLPVESGQTVNVSAYAVKAGEDDSEVASTTFYTVGYSSAVSVDAPAVLDATSSQGLGAVCEGIGLIGSDGQSVPGAERIGGAAANLVFETN